MKTATLPVSHTRSFPRSRSPAITASMTESWTMTRDTGAMTRSPACASRPEARDRIFSARVLGNDPLPQQRVQLIHRERTGVGQGLDPPRDLLELVFAEFEAELFRAMVDSVLSGEAVRDIDRACEPEVGGVEDFIGVGVEIDGLRVHPRLVVESVLPGHEVVVRDLDADQRRDELIQVAQLAQVVLLADRGGVVGVPPRDEAAEGSDAVALADPENARVDVRRPALEDRVAVRDRAAGVVVAVELDVAVHVMAKLHRERVALARRRDPDGVSDAYTVHAHAVHGRVDPEEVALRRAEAVLAREAHLLAVVADEGDDLASVLDDLVDALPVAELAQVRRGPEEDVDTVDAGLDGDPRVVHVATHVRQDLRLQRKGRDGPAVLERLGRGDRRRELAVLDAELIEQLRDGDLLRRREMRVRELLPLAERGVDDREALDRHARLLAHTVQPPSAQRLGAPRATEPLKKTRSHGSASRRGLPRRDSSPPSGGRTSPRSRNGPPTSAVAPWRRISGSSFLPDVA